MRDEALMLGRFVAKKEKSPGQVGCSSPYLAGLPTSTEAKT